MDALRRLAGRAGWSVTSQAVVSAGNFLFAVVTARETSARSFGEISLVFAVYLLCAGVTRGLLGEPLLVLGPADTARSVLGLSLTIGAAIGAAFAAVGLAVGGFIGPIVLAFAATLPFLLLEDALRHVHVARGRPRSAALLDLAWLAGQGVALVVVAVADLAIVWFVLGWGAAAAVAVVGELVRLRVLPSLRGAAQWWRSHGGHGWRFAAEFLAHSSGTHLALFGIAVVSTTVAVAAVRGVQVIMGPFHVLVMGAGLFAVPEGVRIVRESPQGIVRATAGLAAGLAALGVALGLIVWILPETIGEALLGDTWSDAQPVAMPVAIGMALNGAAFATGYGLRALNVPQRNLRARLLALVPFLGLTVVGAAWDDATGAAWGFAAGAAIALLLWWREFRAAVGEDLRSAL